MLLRDICSPFSFPSSPFLTGIWLFIRRYKWGWFWTTQVDDQLSLVAIWTHWCQVCPCWGWPWSTGTPLAAEAGWGTETLLRTANLKGGVSEPAQTKPLVHTYVYKSPFAHKPNWDYTSPRQTIQSLKTFKSGEKNYQEMATDLIWPRSCLQCQSTEHTVTSGLLLRELSNQCHHNFFFTYADLSFIYFQINS